MKTEKKENKKTGERSDAGGDSEGRRKSSYEEEDTIALEEIPEEKLESDIKAGQVRGCKQVGEVWSKLPHSPT